MSYGFRYGVLSKFDEHEIAEITRNDAEVRILSPMNFQIADDPDRAALESRIKSHMLNNEKELKGFFRTEEEDDFLIFVITDKHKEPYILGHPRAPTLKHFIADSDTYRGKTIDIGPINEVYEKLKNNEDKTKHHSALKDS